MHGAQVGSADRVVELGAGTGVLTAALAARAHHVLAIEIDANLVADLARLFSSTPAVTVVHGDALEVPLPATPFRVVANVPFNRTTAILRRLLATPMSALVRADLIVQSEVARKRARVNAGPPTDLLGVTWGAWWAFHRGRRLPATLFRPSPSVDAGVLVVTRRQPELLAASEHRAFVTFVRDGFSHARLRSFLTPMWSKAAVDRLGGELGFRSGTAPRDLDVDQWVELYRACRTR